MASELKQRIDEAAAHIRARASVRPTIGIVLGTGLGGFASALEGDVVIPYRDIPHFPVSAVESHAGELHLGRFAGREVAVMKGRVHFYEGFTAQQVALPARVLCRLGIKALVVTNAAGGIRADFQPGDLMRITDHLNLSGMNPLIGHNDDALGTRFPDMSHAYSPALAELLEACARDTKTTLRSGVYAQLSGPAYETPAEIRMLRTLGADAVGMSTVPEVLVASHMGVPVAGISCITNLAAGISPKALNHAEVSETAERVKDRFSALLSAFLPRAARLG